MSEPEVFVVADAAVAVASAADRISASIGAVVADRGRVDWAVTGGSTAADIYRHLADAPHAAIPWHAVHVWWGDDRFVPRDHPLSNVKAFDDILLGVGRAEEGTAGGRPAGVSIPVEQLHPFRTSEAIGRSRGAAWCATSLADELRSGGLDTDADGWPVFDLVTLGMGVDGHILSVFPGSAALGARDLALAIPAPAHIEPHVERLTLNPAIVTAARRVLVVVIGTEKAEAVAAVLGPDRDPGRWPAQLARHDRATWIVDAAAAGSLDDR